MTRPTRSSVPVFSVANRVRLTPYSQSVYVRAKPSSARLSYSLSSFSSDTAARIVSGV